MERKAGLFLLIAAVLLLEIRPAMGVEIFPWIDATPDDLALESVEAHPDAPAVFLNRKKMLVMGFTGQKGNNTRVDEYRRLKILNAAGLQEATVSLPSIDFARVKRLDARITQPDGSIRMLSQADIFSKTQSKSDRYKIISFALPQAEVGSIIEYRYAIIYENVIRPWKLYFQGWLPVLESTIELDSHEYAEYNINAIGFKGNDPERVTEKRHSQYRNLRTSHSTFTLRDLPLVPEEPFSPPFEEVAARVELMPLKYMSGGQWHALAKNVSWQGLASSYTDRMGKYREWSPKTDAFVEQTVGGLSTDREKAAVLYEFVRAGIRWGQTPCKDGFCPPDKVLKAREGDSWDRTMLLQLMLSKAGLKSALVWMSPRTEAKMVRNFPDFTRINYVLVEVTLDGEQVFLDVRNTSDEFGMLQPHLQGMQCVLVDGRASTWSKTPMLPAEASTRQVKLDLQLTEAGQVKGQGRLVLTGNHAWLRSMWGEDDHPVVSRWRAWMEPEVGGFSSWIAGQFPEFKVEVGNLEWSKKDGGLVGTWEMESADTLPGDFISLPSAAPIGIHRNPFVLTPDQRVTPARLLFPFLEEVEVHVTWPEGWSLDSSPEVEGTESYIGKVSIQREVGTGELTYHRRFSLDDVKVDGDFAYSKLHELYVETLMADMGSIVLVKDE